MAIEEYNSHYADVSIHQRLHRLELEQTRQQKAVKHLRTEFHQIRQNLLRQIHPEPGYVIRLQFSPSSPVHEWEAQRGGWRTQGQGSRYSSWQQAEEQFNKLCLMWPDYPLEIHFCDKR